MGQRPQGHSQLTRRPSCGRLAPEGDYPRSEACLRPYALSEFYRQSPTFISIGDKEKALKHAKLAVEYGPAYAINHLVFAHTLLTRGKRRKYCGAAKNHVSFSPADAIPETRADQETAQSMLRSLGVSPEPPTPCGEAGKACGEKP